MDKNVEENLTDYYSGVVGIYKFEKEFNEDFYYQWLRGKWTDSIWYSMLYIVLIFSGKYFMESRPAYNLRPWLFAWSGILAIFSIIGTIRMVPELVYMLHTYGFEHSICNPSVYNHPPTKFWGFVFACSKLPELIDTVFIVLRKQKLIFLHWYHHVTVLIYSWYAYADHTASGRWFATMNFAVHAVMYSYYCLKAGRIRIPKQVSMVITALQISQMVMGVVVNIGTYQVKERGEYCHTTYDNIKYSFLMYLSYFLLFAQFFYFAYVASKEEKKRQAEKAMTNGVVKDTNANISKKAM